LKGESTEITGALKDLMTQLEKIQKTQETESSDLKKEMIEKFQQLQTDSVAMKREIKSLHVRSVAETQLAIVRISGTAVISVTESTKDGKPLRGVYDGNLVSFQEILRKNEVSDGLPRIVKLYREMTDVAQIQRLYGLAEGDDGVLFAIMEDMGQHVRLADVADGMVARMMRMQKLRLGYELAATVAALHRGKILVKVLSDATTYLERKPGGYIRPKLSDLGHARRVSLDLGSIVLIE
jgi:hypothetical protein